jgi:hypothetical protein
MRRNAVISSDAAISVLNRPNNKGHPKRRLCVLIMYVLSYCYLTIVVGMCEAYKLNCSTALERNKDV